jgi:tripartite-type tricarboxylate transporter receptor subunit TctC
MKLSEFMLAVALAAPAAGYAQAFPAKPVRYIVPMSPGSGADIIGRILAGGMTEVFGQQVIVDNRTGAAGNIGAEAAARSAPDGYTLFQVSMTHAANVSLYRKLPYDLVRDFAPVTLIATSPALLVAHPSLPVKSVADLVKLAKAKPGTINYSSTGAGTASFLGAELLKARSGADLVHVPYRGGGEALTAVLTGEASVSFLPLASGLPQVQQGRLRALAITTTKRIPLLPELPTVAEAGYPGYASGNWYGVVAPARTPREVVNAIRNAAVTAMQSPAVSKRMSDLAYVAVASQPEEFAAHIKSEVETLAKIIKQAGITAD